MSFRYSRVWPHSGLLSVGIGLSVFVVMTGTTSSYGQQRQERPANLELFRYDLESNEATTPLIPLNQPWSETMPTNQVEAIPAKTPIPANRVETIPANPDEAVNSNIIYVNPHRGDDHNGEGTERSPWRTITHTVNHVGPNQIIQLAPGTYNAATGEQFPLQLPPGVKLQGNPHLQGRNYVIQGGGVFASAIAGEQYATIIAGENSQIMGVTVIHRHSQGVGILMASGQPTIRQNTFLRNGKAGILASGTSQALIEQNRFLHNGSSGVIAMGRTRLAVRDNFITQSGIGIRVEEQAQVQLVGNQIDSNRIGVQVNDLAQATLRRNLIANSIEYGLVSLAQSQVDLGTTAEPGQNTLRHNRRLDLHNLTRTQTISAIGNQIEGRTQGHFVFDAAQVPDSQALNATSAPLPPTLPPAKAAPVQEPASITPPTPTQLPKQSPAQPLATLTPTPSPALATSPPTAKEELPTTSAPAPQPATSSVSPNLEQSGLSRLLVLEPQPLPAQGPVPTNPTLPAPVPKTPPPIVPTPPPGDPLLQESVPPEESVSNPDMASTDALTTSEEALPGRSPTSSVVQPASTQQYRVFVNATSEAQKMEVKSLYPDAFAKVHQGRSVLQIGVFSTQKNAEQALQSIKKLGLSGVLLPSG